MSSDGDKVTYPGNLPAIIQHSGHAGAWHPKGALNREIHEKKVRLYHPPMSSLRFRSPALSSPYALNLQDSRPWQRGLRGRSSLNPFAVQTTVSWVYVVWRDWDRWGCAARRQRGCDGGGRSGQEGEGHRDMTHISPLSNGALKPALPATSYIWYTGKVVRQSRLLHDSTNFLCPSYLLNKETLAFRVSLAGYKL